MIHPLRAIHRYAFLGLGVVLPAVFASGLLARHQWPALTLPSQDLPMGSVVAEQVVDFDGRKSAVDVYANRNAPGTVQFASKKPLVAPDLLVYCSEVSSPSALPVDARLLGSYQPGMRYGVPLQGRARGTLILYSAARQQVIGTFPMVGQQ